MYRSTFRLCCLGSAKSYKTVANKNYDLNFAVSEAEKIVGYPTSFLNLRWLLTDEMANVAFHFRKLIGTNHPLLETARKLFIGTAMPAWGLIVLLISKSGGLNTNFPDVERDLTAGVLHSQRALAEVTEMIRTSNLIHKSLMNMDEKTKEHVMDLVFGNKISLLSGDYLLSKSFQELAYLKNQNLNELMSSALRDLVEAEFIGPRDKQDMPLPNKPLNKKDQVIIRDYFDTKPYNVNEVLGNPCAEWTLRNILGSASLLGKSCQGALRLAHHSDDVQELGYLFGKNLALAWKMQEEREIFATDNSSLQMFSLICAPVMIHLDYDPSLYEKIEIGKDDVSKVDYADLRRTIQNGPALERSREYQKQFSLNALNVLSKLPKSDATTALEKIIYSMFN